MPLEISNIILTNAVAYYAPYGTPLPPDTLAVNGTWPIAWNRLGFTGAPLNFGYEYTTLEADVQESLAPVNIFKTKETLSLETSLMEFDLGIVTATWEGSANTTAAAAGVPSVQVFNIGGRNALTKRTWAFEGGWVNTAGVELPIRVIIWRAAPSGGSGIEFSKEKFIGFPVKLMALADLSKPMGERFFQIRKVLAPGL